MKINTICSAGMLPAMLLTITGGKSDARIRDNGQEEKPDILIIHCDQLAAWTLGCYGGTEIGTPNIDGLASDGVVLTNFYANTPVSTPSRGCFMSGLYPTEHGAYKNNLMIRQDIPTFASELRDAGYETGYAGKWHLDGSPKRPGWDIRGKDMGWTDRSAMYEFGHYKEILEREGQSHPEFTKEMAASPETYPTDWFTSRAISFMDEHRDEPFCFMLSIPDPHGPYSVRSPYDTMYPEQDMKLPSTLTDEPLDDNFLYHESRLKKDKKTGKTEYQTILENIRKDRAQYFGMIKCIDENVGRITDFLKKEGLYDDMIIVFTADHGDMMGEHARMAKAVPFESAARIPFIVKFPDSRVTGVRDQVASVIDFYPTILSIAGVQQKGKTSGQDMTSFLVDPKAGDPDEVEILRCYAESYPWLCAVDGRYKLICGQKEEPGEALLLDRKKNPEETVNYFHDPEYREVVERLEGKLIDYCIEHGDSHWVWLAPQLTGQPAMAKVSVTSNPEGLGFGFWSNHSRNDLVFDDFGRRPYERYGFFSWKAIEKKKGVYDTRQIIEGIGKSHRLGSTCIISLNNISGPWFNKAKGSQIPSFYPQDIRNPETREAGKRYIYTVIKEVLSRTGNTVVCFDYEMMWHCKPDTPEKQKMLSEWFVDAVAEARRAAADLGMSDALKVIPIVNGATDDSTLMKFFGNPSENHVPAKWLTDMVSVCDYLAIDSYDFDIEHPEDPTKTLNTLSFWIRNYSQGKPVLITEFGYSTGNSYYPDYRTHYHATGTEEQQAAFYKALIPMLEKENVPGGKLNGQVRCFCFWMYSDMNTKKAVYQRENHFGLVRLDGSRKPAFDIVHRGIDKYEETGMPASPYLEVSRTFCSGEPGGFVYSSGTEFDYMEIFPEVPEKEKVTVTVNLENEGAVLLGCGDKWLRSTDDSRRHSFEVEVEPGDRISLYFTGAFYPFRQTVKSVVLK